MIRTEKDGPPSIFTKAATALRSSARNSIAARQQRAENRKQFWMKHGWPPQQPPYITVTLLAALTIVSTAALLCLTAVVITLLTNYPNEISEAARNWAARL